MRQAKCGTCRGTGVAQVGGADQYAYQDDREREETPVRNEPCEDCLGSGRDLGSMAEAPKGTRQKTRYSGERE